MQIKEVAKGSNQELLTEHIWSQVNLYYFGLPKTLLGFT